MFAYSLALAAALAISSPWWLLRMMTSGKYREGLRERLGSVPKRLKASQEARQAIWIHAVSVGEVIAASGLIRELKSRAGGYRVVISTTTRTGQKIARDRFGAENVFYFPLDFAWAVRRYLRALKPAMLVLVETEFWPRVLWECRRAGVLVAVVNARISDRSYPRYLRLKRFWAWALQPVKLALGQTEVDCERLKAIGMRPEVVRQGGNLKYDVKATEPSEVTVALRQALPRQAKLLVCGSTLAGEEEILLQAWPRLLQAEPQLRMVLAPRHPERLGEVVQLLGRSGLSWIRRSEWIRGASPLSAGTVMLLDSMGELASVYSLAVIAFVGGSLVTAGGHNPLEPAQFAVPVVMGPHYANFRGIVEKLRSKHAIRIADRDEFADALVNLLTETGVAREMGRRAKEVFEAEAGATDRAALALVGLLAGDAT